MNFVLLAPGVVIFLGNAFAFVRKCKKACRQQARFSLTFSYLSSFLFLFSIYVLIPVGLSEAHPDIIVRALLRPSYLFALAVMALGMALPLYLTPSRRENQPRFLSGKESLGIVLYFLIMLVSVAHHAYAAGNLLLFGILSLGGGVIFAFGLFPFLRKLKATWKRPRAVNWLPVLLGLPFILGGAILRAQSINRFVEPYWFGFEHVRVSYSGRIAMRAWSKERGAFIVSDPEGERILELLKEKEDESQPYAEWSRDGRDLYVIRREGPPGDEGTVQLWRYSVSGRTSVLLREIGHSIYQVSPDGRKVLFVRKTRRESEWRTQLVCGAMENEHSDQIICEGGPRFWARACAWGPSSDRLYFPTFRYTSVPHGPGLWVLDLDAKGVPQPKLVVANEGASALVCNATETHLAMLRHVRTGERWRPVLEVVELASLTAQRIAGEARLVNVFWEDELVWDRDGFRLAFADSQGLKTYDARTGKVRRLVAAKETSDSAFGYELFVPVMWLPKAELLFTRDYRSFHTYDPKSGRVRNSPLTKGIRKWLKRH